MYSVKYNKQLNYKSIVSYLKKHDDDFTPCISKITDISKYSLKLSKQAKHFYVEGFDNEIFGFAAAYYNDFKNMTGYLSYIHLNSIIVGKGYGKKLLLAVIDYGKENNFELLRLEVNKTNKSAIELYRKFGFENELEKKETHVLILKLTE